MESFDRVKLLIGEDIFDKIKNKKVAIFGLGGVGGPTCDAIARFGISNLLLVDFDIVKESNMNRLSIADGRDIGKPKTEVMKNRILSFNKEANILTYDKFMDSKTYDELIESYDPDFCVDAVDSLNPKIATIERLYYSKRKFISSMGAGGRFDPSQVKYGRLDDVVNCGLATRIRSILRKHNIRTNKIKTVYSTEQPIKPIPPKEGEISERGRTRGTQASCMIVPTVFGMFIAHKVISYLIEEATKEI
jgi:tRNA A37 threonylcarbamoyladenosine dehydratase